MPRRELQLELLTSDEVGLALDQGMSTVVVAVAAVEQHGPHLPLFTDAARGDYLALEVARRLGDALVAPTIRVGCSEHHMAFSGTLSLRPETLRAVCLDYCTSLARHGFRKICLLPSHGGNFGPLAHGLDDFNDAVAPEARVLAYTDLNGFLDVWRAAVDEVAGLGDRVGGHADIAESSEMMALHSRMVRWEPATPGFTGEVSGEVLDRLLKEGLHTVTESGILGDARGMSEAIGRRCLEATVELLATHFSDNHVSD